MQQISNGIIQVSIAEKGAELQSIILVENQLEYMWSGNPAYWSKKSPVLFPIVGGLKNNNYQYNGSTYTLPRHGFARDKEFTVTALSAGSITLTLVEDAESLQVYPFKFSFSITYTLDNNIISVSYLVENKNDAPMYFSVGAHPAFAVPLIKGTHFSDYYLAFNQSETSGKWPLSSAGLIREAPDDFLQDTKQLPLTKELFYGDALVFKDLNSTVISILSEKTEHRLKVSYKDFPYMGIWSSKDADFVCIEPWCGIADSVGASGNLEEKEGINTLEPDEEFKRSWSIEVF